MSYERLSTFLVRVCSIVGGIYAVSSIIESVLRNSLSIFWIGDLSNPINPKAVKKIELRVTSSDTKVAKEENF